MRDLVPVQQALGKKKKKTWGLRQKMTGSYHPFFFSFSREDEGSASTVWDFYFFDQPLRILGCASTYPPP